MHWLSILLLGLFLCRGAAAGQTLGLPPSRSLPMPSRPATLPKRSPPTNGPWWPAIRPSTATCSAATAWPCRRARPVACASSSARAIAWSAMKSRKDLKANAIRPVLSVSDGFIGKQIIFQFLIEARIVTPNPFKNH